jgi:diadenosine tetraphosphate (Ap4A) HIT family hydrolase
LLGVQDEKFVVFPDIRPAAEHHYLVCPREHIRNAKVLTKDDLPLGNVKISDMLQVSAIIAYMQY